MFVALNGNKELIDAYAAIKGNEYYCPCCNGELVVKEGEVNIKHFAHKSLTSCDTFSNDMSEWHKMWQNQFRIEQREVIIENEGIKHRADILFNGYVVEFQNSPISAEEFNERNEFYVKAGYKVIWIFNKQCEFECGQIREHRETDYGMVYKYKNASKTFKRHKYFLLGSKVSIYFQLGKEYFEDECCYLAGITWAIKEEGGYNFRYFGTNYDLPANIIELKDSMLARRI